LPRMVDQVTPNDYWFQAAIVIALLCALALVTLILRWGVRKVPFQGKAKRFVQTLTVGGALVGLVPGGAVGVVMGSDIGGALFGVPFLLIGLPPGVPIVVGMFLFLNTAVLFFTLAGAAAGFAVGSLIICTWELASSKLRA
jgi:hypothetical protein